MATFWAGGEDPTIPTHYTYIHDIPIEIPIRKKMFWHKQFHKREWKTVVEIITSKQYYSLSPEEQAKCKPSTIGDVEEFGSMELKNNAEQQFAERLSGLG
jgi:hypothetical protein